MKKIIKNKLKRVKYSIESFLYLMRRTVFKVFHQICIPFSGSIHFDKHVLLGSHFRLYLYDGTMNIGENVTFCNYSKIIIGCGGKLSVGKNSQLGEYGIYNTFSELVIGEDVITADRISFVTNVHQYEDVNVPIKNQPAYNEPIIIGDGTWIGMNATILAGTTIGKNSVVAAHAVVKGSFPDYCVLGGVPARIIKQYDKESGIWKKYKK